jgi:large subunit ribosomal protein L3
MAIGAIGRKLGMTRIFTADGSSVPVTVIEMEPNRVTAIRTAERGGYDAVQVTTGNRHANRTSRPEAGVFAKAGTPAGRGLWELRCRDGAPEGLEVGAEITVEAFAEVKRVDVCGTTIGKGFAGTIKRHNFRGQRNTHGNSLSHRVGGSIGQNQTPGRVFKGKKMAGHMGNVRRTTQNLELVRVDAERNLLLVKGAVPGPKGGDVIVRPSVKARA